MIQLFPSRTVAIDLFGFPVHWYGLLYLLAFIIAWFLLPFLQRKRNLQLSRDEWAGILSAAVIGVIVGGRLGYVLFYAPLYYLQHPLDIFAVWNGGMASHGGFIGVAIALWIVLRKRGLDDLLTIADIVVIPVAIGLGLGRIGNFINQELYGTVTTLPWGMYFPGAVGKRHPIQFYDFGLQMINALLLYVHLTRVQPVRPGRTMVLFLFLYGFIRFFIEFIREQNGLYYTFAHITLSEGQWLTIPLLLIAALLWWWTGRRKLKMGN
ncbi:MAG TPA: prolipoprotein diacylglyceryl transferase [Candidatus Peribacteraceae bacterium]|nr:prolipoprotein diacylglyceryl transferase [Candidatus Peribacteraceae bacterium]